MITASTTDTVSF